MRRLILLVALAALAHPAGAGTQVTVAQLDQALTAAITAHKPDAEIARQIASLELFRTAYRGFAEPAEHTPGTGRLGGAGPGLARRPGRPSWTLRWPSCRVVLLLTAPPANECSMPRATMLRKRCRVCQTSWPPGPSSDTTSSPQALKKGAWPVRTGLHLVGTSSREISVRNEREVQGVKHGSEASQQQNGLST